MLLNFSMTPLTPNKWLNQIKNPKSIINTKRLPVVSDTIKNIEDLFDCKEQPLIDFVSDLFKKANLECKKDFRKKYLFSKVLYVEIFLDLELVDFNPLYYLYNELKEKFLKTFPLEQLWDKQDEILHNSLLLTLKYYFFNYIWFDKLLKIKENYKKRSWYVIYFWEINTLDSYLYEDFNVKAILDNIKKHITDKKVWILFLENEAHVIHVSDSNSLLRWLEIFYILYNKIYVQNHT